LEHVAAELHRRNENQGCSGCEQQTADDGACQRSVLFAALADANAVGIIPRMIAPAATRKGKQQIAG
jgi:hypothetical protein